MVLRQPAAADGVYGVMLGPLLKATHYTDYPIFILAGLIVWLFFAQALLAGASSLVDQASLVRRSGSRARRSPPPSVTVQLVPLTAMLVVLVPVTIAVRGNASTSLLLLAPLVVCLFAFTLGLALIVSVAARVLPRRPADPDRADGAVVLSVRRLFALQRLPGVQTTTGSSRCCDGSTRSRRSSSRCARSSTTARTEWGELAVRRRARRPSRSSVGAAVFSRSTASWRWSCDQPSPPARSCSEDATRWFTPAPTRRGRSRSAARKARRRPRAGPGAPAA